jgi:hypothetical protein
MSVLFVCRIVSQILDEMRLVLSSLLVFGLGLAPVLKQSGWLHTLLARVGHAQDSCCSSTWYTGRLQGEQTAALPPTKLNGRHTQITPKAAVHTGPIRIIYEDLPGLKAR